MFHIFTVDVQLFSNTILHKNVIVSGQVSRLYRDLWAGDIGDWSICSRQMSDRWKRLVNEKGFRPMAVMNLISQNLARFDRFLLTNPVKAEPHLLIIISNGFENYFVKILSMSHTYRIIKVFW